jgi:CubicO group peptidase (beta-lactamase class C family)
MTSMKKKLSLIFVALLTCAAVAVFTRDFVSASSARAIKAQPASPSVEERIRRVEAGLVTAVVIKGTSTAMPLAERMKFYKVPGVSVAVVNNGKIEWARGFGVKDVSTNEPVTTETLFQAGSISKPVAALAALRLVQDGKLALDEDVNAKLVSWKLPDNEFTKENKVTLRRLLTHSAGLTVHGFPGYADGAAVPTLVQVLNGEKPANTEAIRVEAVPGTIWNYSGGGYTIMQQMLIDVAKKPFPDIVKQLVLDPAGMKHSAYEQPLSTARAKDAATAHVGGQPIKGRFHTYPEMAAAGLWTTPTDLAALIIELQKSLAGSSNKIISKEMTAQMLSRQFGTWGLGPGVEVKGQTVEFTHGGSDEGFESFWAGFSDGRGAVVMTNGDRGDVLAMEVLRAVAREYGWAEHAPREREVAKVDPKIYESYVGDYEFKISQQLNITIGVLVEGGKLLIQQNGGVKREWLPASETEYFSLSSGNTINFVKDAQGKVTELVINQGGETYHGKKTK